MASGAITLIGDKQLLRLLDRAEKKLQRSAARKAVNAGARIVRKAIRAATPVEEGNLKRSMDYKVVGKGASLNAIIGSNSAYTATDDSGQRVRPDNYDHLVEYGYQHPSGVTVAGHHMLERGYNSSIKAAEAAMTKKLREALTSATK